MELSTLRNTISDTERSSAAETRDQAQERQQALALLRADADKSAALLQQAQHRVKALEGMLQQKEAALSSKQDEWQRDKADMINKVCWSGVIFAGDQ